MISVGNSGRAVGEQLAQPPTPIAAPTLTRLMLDTGPPAARRSAPAPASGNSTETKRRVGRKPIAVAAATTIAGHGGQRVGDGTDQQPHRVDGQRDYDVDRVRILVRE